MNFFISDAMAQGAAPASQQGDPVSFMIMTVVFIGLMYFLMIRPHNKRAKQHREMVAELKKGEEVVTNGGLLGKIVAMNDNFISLEISKDVVIHVQKQSVQTVMPKGTIKEQANG